MLKRIGNRLGNIKLTTMIAGLVISAVIVSVGVVTVAIYLNLSAATRETALNQQVTNLKTAATIVQSSLPGAEVRHIEPRRMWSDEPEEDVEARLLAVAPAGHRWGRRGG